MLIVGLVIIIGSVVILILGLNAGSLFRTDDKIPASYQREVIYPHTNETMYLRIKLTSETFGAQSPIKAEIFLFPDHVWRESKNMNYSDLAPQYFVIFDGSGCPQPTDSKYYGQISACVVPMDNVTERSSTYPDGVTNYKGENEIKFAQGGRYSVIITDFTGTGTDMVVYDLIQIEPISTTLDSRYFLFVLIANVIGIIITVAGVLRQWQQRPNS